MSLRWLFSFLVVVLSWTASVVGQDAPLPLRLESVLTWGEVGEEDGQFHSPIGITIDSNNVLYVTEFRNDRVQIFDTNGKFLGKFAVADMPGGIAVDREGAIYVAPMMEHRICVYDRTGKLLREWGKKGTGDGEFDQPGGIAIGPDDHVYVADQVNRRIQVFRLDGTFVRKWGEYGTAPGQFDGVDKLPNRTGGPNFVAVDHRGRVWTTEAAPGRIQRFSPQGEPQFAFGNNTTERGGFGGRPKNLPGPIAILVDPDDRVWVTATNHRVQVFNSTGELIGGFESLEPGHEPGQFETPHGLVRDSEGFLYVVDSQNHRIQKVRVTAE